VWDQPVAAFIGQKSCPSQKVVKSHRNPGSNDRNGNRWSTSIAPSSSETGNSLARIWLKRSNRSRRIRDVKTSIVENEDRISGIFIKTRPLASRV
jgi:hypothetical protein